MSIPASDEDYEELANEIIKMFFTGLTSREIADRLAHLVQRADFSGQKLTKLIKAKALQYGVSRSHKGEATTLPAQYQERCKKILNALVAVSNQK